MQEAAESEEAKKYAGLAECLGMCPAEEVENRVHVEAGTLSPFEQNSTGDLKCELLVKRYARSAADKEKKIPALNRPPIIIFMTVEYLRLCVADQDRYPSGTSYYKY